VGRDFGNIEVIWVGRQVKNYEIQNFLDKPAHSQLVCQPGCLSDRRVKMQTGQDRAKDGGEDDELVSTVA
jgi:hypothetical protein